MAVVIVEAATCGVAIAATAAIEGSSIATAAGVATAFPEVLEQAAPATPVPPVALSETMLKKPPIPTVKSPKKMPGSPAFTNIS